MIKSLGSKKFREQYNAFVAEGHKLVYEMFEAKWPVNTIFATGEYLDKINTDFPNLETNIVECSSEEIKKISRLNSPPEIIAIANKKEQSLAINSLQNELVLALDYIQDPGNFGTIIRLCSWFGIKKIICSSNSADLYNPKVIQASMGGFINVDIHYVDLPEFIINYKKETANPVYGTFIEGENINTMKKQQASLIVMGNEGKGVSDDVAQQIDYKLYIPPYDELKPHVESLNIAIATSIVVSAFRQ